MLNGTNDSHLAMNDSNEIQIYCNYRLQLPLSTLKPHLVTPFLTIFFVLTFTSTSLNTLVFTLLFKNKQMRQKRHIQLLLCLSASDLLVGALVSPTSIAQILVGTGSGQCFVNRIAGGAHILMATANLIITTISFDRYTLIVHNKSYYNILNSRRFSCMLALPWVVSLVLILLAIFYRTYFMWCQLLLSISTYICFITSYWKIHAHLSQREHYWGQAERSNILAINRRRNKRATHIMATIIIATLSCSGLLFLSIGVYLLDYYGIGGIEWLKTWRHFYLGVLGNILLQSNSTFNPILYISISKEFKGLLFNTFKLRKHGEKSPRNTTVTIVSQEPAVLFSHSSLFEAKVSSMRGRINETFEEEEGCASVTSGPQDFTEICFKLSNLDIHENDINYASSSTLETKL